MKILKSYTAPFAPTPNTAQWITQVTAPAENLVSSCFALLTYQDSLILIKHISRGLEIPGGHKENNESSEQCVRREILEECGVAKIENLNLIAYEKISVQAPCPQDYKYPYPDSFQLLYTGEVSQLEQFTPNLDSMGREIIPLTSLRNHPIYNRYGFLFELILNK